MLPQPKEEMPSSFSIDHQQQDDNQPRKYNRLESCALATLIIILLIISIITTITLLVIIYRLRLIPGLEFFTIISDNVILHKPTYIDRLLLTKNRISGLKFLSGNLLLESGQTSLKLNENSIKIHSKNGLEIRSNSNGKLLFPFNSDGDNDNNDQQQQYYQLPLNTIKTLTVPNGLRDLKMIRSSLDDDLLINSKQNLRLRGNNGILMEGKQISLNSKLGIFLSSINNTIVLNGKQGIYLNMDSFKKRIVRNKQSSSSSTVSSSSIQEEKNLQYKLCICGRNGRLFRMAIKDSSSSCADARFPQSDNPCL